MRHFGVESADYPCHEFKIKKVLAFKAGLDVAEIPRFAAWLIL